MLNNLVHTEFLLSYLVVLPKSDLCRFKGKRPLLGVPNDRSHPGTYLLCKLPNVYSPPFIIDLTKKPECIHAFRQPENQKICNVMGSQPVFDRAPPNKKARTNPGLNFEFIGSALIYPRVNSIRPISSPDNHNCSSI